MRYLLAMLAVLALASCVDRSITKTVPEALEIGTNYTVFAASSRGPEASGSYGYNRSERLRFLDLTVSIPPGHTPGTLKFSYANPNPKKQFALAHSKEFADADAFRASLRHHIRSRPNADGEVTIFVHGFNATQTETAFRAAQLANDIQIPGTLMVYSWPSKGKPLAYAYDGDSALFARDGLERAIREVKAAGAKRILLVAHSMGSLLTMETLRQMDIKDPGWAGRNIGGVVLISPDLDVDVFRAQMARITNPPDPIIIFVSAKDKILNISARLRGTHDTQRLGSLSSVEFINDLPVEIIDTTAFSDTAGSAHFVPATSPALLALMGSARSVSHTFAPEEFTVETMLAGVDMQRGPDEEVILRPLNDSPK